MKKYYTVTTPENLRSLCIRKNWFTCGSNEQYDKTATLGERRKNMTCRENCIHYAVCYKKPDHFDDLDVNGGCSGFQDKGEMEITREFIVDNGLEFELLSYYERKRKRIMGRI